MHQIGVNVILHCFDYGRGRQPELEKYCAQVYYYKRHKSFWKQFSTLPFIVISRKSDKLLENLQKDDYPVFFEGYHTTYYLTHKTLKNRLKIVRSHNVEHHYYELLKKQENFWPRRLFFGIESKKLKKYERILQHTDIIAAISPNDAQYFSNNFDQVIWLPPFHSNKQLTALAGSGNYALYHGNLSVPENIEAALFLITAFKNKNIPLILAGKNPAKSIINAIAQAKNIELKINPDFKQMTHLIQDAHIQLLPTFQPTGIKLKLIESLFLGRHIIANNAMIKGTGTEKLCHVANSKEAFVVQAQKLMQIPFENKDLILRKELLSKKFDNERNASLLMQIINEKINH